MGSDYKHAPNSFKLTQNENSDIYEQFKNGDYKSLSRESSIKDNDNVELKEIKNKINNNRVVRRIRTNSFNTNYTSNNSKTNSHNTLGSNSIIQDLNDFKSSVKKIFVGSKQKLSPSSSINLHSNEKRKQKKRSFSHSFSHDYEECFLSEEDDVDEENEEDYEEDHITTKPLLSRSNSKVEKKNELKMNSKTNEIPKNLIISTTTTTSNESYLPSSDSASSKSVYSELIETKDIESDENNNQSNLNDRHKHTKEILNQNSVKIQRVDSIRMRHNSNLAHTDLTTNMANTNFPNSINETFVQYKKVKSRKRSHEAKNYIAVIILFVVNLLNYMDRFTLAGTKNNNFVFSIV